MRISIVVAVAKNGVIGKDGALAWKISDDLKRFRSLTAGKPVVMGRKTFDSIGKPLKDRVNIVVSRTMSPVEGVFVERSIEGALVKARIEAARNGVDEICVIGGAEIYRKVLPLADRIHLTEVDAATEGDVHFPTIDAAEWARRPDGACEKSSRNEHSCRFFILDRR